MSSASTADRPPGPGRAPSATPDRGDVHSAVAPRSAAAGACDDPYRWRGLGRPRRVTPDVRAARDSAAEDLYPWRGLHPTPIDLALSDPVATGGRRTDDAPATSPRVQGAGVQEASIVIIGLGNPILGDDGVGWRVADVVEARLGARTSGIRVERAALGGLALMERLVGADRAILVDAIETGVVPAGTVTRMSLDDVGCRSAEHLDSAHDASLTMALAAGRALGADLPFDVSVVAVEARHVDTFSDELSADVSAAVPAAADAVLGLLGA
jgi:hydrogenase maturation protease